MKIYEHLCVMRLIIFITGVLYPTVVIGQDGSGTFGDTTFAYFLSPIWDFDNAKLFCEGFAAGGKLAETSDETIMDFVSSLGFGSTKLYVGSEKTNGEFTWIYSNTATTGVTGAGNGKDCVYYTNNKLKGARCTDTYGAICSMPANHSSVTAASNTDKSSLWSALFAKSKTRHRRTSDAMTRPRPSDGVETNQPRSYMDVTAEPQQRESDGTANNPTRPNAVVKAQPYLLPDVIIKPRPGGDVMKESHRDADLHKILRRSFTTSVPTFTGPPRFTGNSFISTRLSSTPCDGPCQVQEGATPPSPISTSSTNATSTTPTTSTVTTTTVLMNASEVIVTTPNTTNATTTTMMPSTTTTAPKVEGNVSQVAEITRNTSFFSSPAFVSSLEVWLDDNDEIPDDLSDDERIDYARGFFDVCNNAFEADLLALGQTDAASEIADSCSNLAQDLAQDLDAGESIDISTEYVDVYASVQKSNNFTGFKQVIVDDSVEGDHDADSVQVVYIPSDIIGDLHLTEDDEIGVSVVVYKRGHFIVDHDNDSVDVSHRPASSVVSITVSVNDNVTSVPVEFQLEKDVSHLLPDNASQYEVGNDSCVFWDSHGNGEGEWSDYGCIVLNSTQYSTLCSCNHTTHFGVLLQVRPLTIDTSSEVALTFISYVGGGISIACLLITLIILNCLTSLTSVRVKIHKNLVAALLIAQTIFLLISIASRHVVSCKSATLILHYFYLAVFCWSLLEGANLYVQIVQVFSTGKTLKYWHYLLFGWGVPVPIVAISAGVKWRIYGAGQQCWLTPDEGLIWAFAGPVIVVIAVNIFILVMVVKVIVNSAAAHKTENYAHIKAGVKGALLLVPILGLSWIFGFLSLGNNATLVFTYLFVIAVSIQGVLIFLLYCAFNSEVRAALKRKYEKRNLRKEGGQTTGPTPSTVNTREESSSSFANKLLDRLKRRRSSTPLRGKTSSPVDTIHLMERSGSAQSAHSMRDITIRPKRQGSIDSGYSHNLMHTPRDLPGGSMASIRTEVMPDEDFIPPNTPTYT